MNRLVVVFATGLLLGCSGATDVPPSDSSGAPPSAPPASQQAASENNIVQAAPSARATARIQPSELVYEGAFKLPGPSGGSNWEYSGYAAAYYPAGDPDGADDGYPGSIFAVGHDHQQMVSEISIPAPVVSASKNVAELNTAQTLQPFHDIGRSLFGDLEIPRAGLEYLPSNSGGPGKLHFCWGQHFQEERDPSHGFADLTLTAPHPAGPWRLDDYTDYVTNDYLFEIPAAWAAQHLPGYRLATGRFRDGQWGGLGPALLAYKPPDEKAPPPAGATIDEVRPLMMYGTPQPGVAELEVSDEHKMNDFSEADEWSGGAWLTSGDRAAVILVGTKGTGKTWYGFANGVVYPTSGDPNEPVPEVPPFPYDARGWWSEGVSAQVLFFDPADFAAVARGETPTWQPQPYATLAIDKYLFDPGYDHVRQKRYLVGACCLDRARGLLYLIERQVKQDEERSLVHVFAVAPSSP